VANATILYACTAEGLFILTKPGTLTEWLPPRRALQGQAVTSVWAEPGPPIRVLAVSEGQLLSSENGGRTWEAVEPFDDSTPITALVQAGDPPAVCVTAEDGRSAVSHDGGVTWSALEDGAAIAGLSSDVQVALVLPGPAGKPPALIRGTQSGLDVSADGGETWGSVDLPVPGGVATLARDPERRDRLYAATESGYLLESGDRARTWHVINASPLPRAGYLFAIRI